MKFAGWVSVGNEIDGMDIREAIERLKSMEDEVSDEMA